MVDIKDVDNVEEATKLLRKYTKVQKYYLDKTFDILDKFGDKIHKDELMKAYINTQYTYISQEEGYKHYSCGNYVGFDRMLDGYNYGYKKGVNMKDIMRKIAKLIGKTMAKLNKELPDEVPMTVYLNKEDLDPEKSERIHFSPI